MVTKTSLMHLDDTTKLIKKLCLAFNDYKISKQNKNTWNNIYDVLIREEQDYTEGINEIQIKDRVRKRIDRVFDIKTINRSTVQAKLKSIVELIKIITNVLGDSLELDAFGDIKIENDKFKFQSDNVYKIYFNSVDGNLIYGTCILAKEAKISGNNVASIEVANTCSAEIYRKGRKTQFAGTYSKIGGFMNIGLTKITVNGDEDGPVLLQLIFKEKNHDDNIFIGAAQLKIRGKSSSHLCVMTLNDIEDSFISIVEYILNERLSAQYITNIHYTEHKITSQYGQLPDVISMWNGIRAYSGYYKAPFIHPGKKFIVFVIKIKNGKVTIHWNRDLLNPYIGYIRVGNIGDTRKIIINAAYTQSYMDFRLKIYLEDHNNDSVLKGIYSCILTDGNTPHACKIVLKKIDIDDSGISKNVFLQAGVDKLTVINHLKKFDFFEYFENDEDLFLPYAISV